MKPTKILICMADLTLEVKNWWIKMPFSQSSEIPRKMARQFLMLLSKSKEERLSSEEVKMWAEIIRSIDYPDFCLQRMQPRYVEGLLLRCSPQFSVCWHDHKIEIIAPTLTKSLSILSQGDRFSAMVKFDVDGNVSSIEGVELIAV